MASTLSPLPTAAADAGPDAGTRHLFFRVGDRRYGCDIDRVREIVPFQRCTRLPGAPADVCGLINLRGTVVTVLDLGVRLGGAPVERGSASVILVEEGTRVVGVAVSQLRDVQRLLPSEVHPAGTGGEDGGVATGLTRAGGEVVVLLDLAAIIKQTLG